MVVVRHGLWVMGRAGERVYANGTLPPVVVAYVSYGGPLNTEKVL